MFKRNIQIIKENRGLFLLATILDIITIIMIVLFFRYVV